VRLPEDSLRYAAADVGRQTRGRARACDRRYRDECREQPGKAMLAPLEHGCDLPSLSGVTAGRWKGPRGGCVGWCFRLAPGL